MNGTVPNGFDLVITLPTGADYPALTTNTTGAAIARTQTGSAGRYDGFFDFAFAGALANLNLTDWPANGGGGWSAATTRQGAAPDAPVVPDPPVVPLTPGYPTAPGALILVKLFDAVTDERGTARVAWLQMPLLPNDAQGLHFMCGPAGNAGSQVFMTPFLGGANIYLRLAPGQAVKLRARSIRGPLALYPNTPNGSYYATDGPILTVQT